MGQTISKVIYSHWSKPFKLSNSKAFGFNSLFMFGATALLSILKTKEAGFKTELVTDDEGKKFLIDKLNLPFDSVSLELNELKHIDEDQWAIGKLKACSIQTEPFMHQDFDVIWFKRPSKKLLTSETFFQSKEKDSKNFPFYLPYLNHASKHFKSNSSLFPFLNLSSVDAYNCGVIGFNLPKEKTHIIKEWYKIALDYSEYYKNHILTFKTDRKKYNNLSSIIFEQQFIKSICDYYKLDVALVIKSWQDFEKNEKEIGYTHLIGHTKRKKNIEDKVIQRLMKDYPVEFLTLYNTIYCVKNNFTFDKPLQ